MVKKIVIVLMSFIVSTNLICFATNETTSESFQSTETVDVEIQLDDYDEIEKVQLSTNKITENQDIDLGTLKTITEEISEIGKFKDNKDSIGSQLTKINKENKKAILHIDKTNAFNEAKTFEVLDKKYVNANKDKLKGLKITCLGDSITQGRMTDTEHVPSYADAMSTILDAEIVNMGIGGTTIGLYEDQSFIERYKDIPTDSDIILIFGGINDYFIGQYDSFGSYVTTLVYNVKTNYPNAEVYVVIPYNIPSDTFGGGTELLNAYMSQLKSKSEEQDVKIIDLYNENYFNSNDIGIRTSYLPDSIHTNEAGSELLAYHLLHKILESYSVTES